MNNDMYKRYFSIRNVSEQAYLDYKMPRYIENILPKNRNARILDIGCGFGQVLLSLRNEQYIDVSGVDISDEAISSCQSNGLCVTKISSLDEFCRACEQEKKQYDFIIMSHVLEHIDKQKIIYTLQLIRTCIMAPGASLLIMVPNAQSNTGCYWAYEDFTHTTLFTAGSLYFVLKAAGFDTVQFLDPDGIVGSRPGFKQLRVLFLFIYKMNIRFWNLVTASSFHQPSPQIFTYELKVLANN